MTAQQMRVPCGQCMACRINTGRIWSARIIMEWLESPIQPYFLTFTYSDDKIPHPEIIQHLENRDRICGSLEKQYVLQWIKNTQRDHTGRFRYYLVGEYGDRRGRAHYHMAVFPQHHAQIRALAAQWTKGNVQIAQMSHARARYLANYTAKKLTKGTDPRLVPGQEPEFRTSSRNPPIGDGFISRLANLYSRKGKHRTSLSERGDVPRSFRWDGKIYPIGGWALKTLRKRLGVPESHKARIKANANYLKYHDLEEAQCDPEAQHAQEVAINAKTISKKYRTPHQKF